MIEKHANPYLGSLAIYRSMGYINVNRLSNRDSCFGGLTAQLRNSPPRTDIRNRYIVAIRDITSDGLNNDNIFTDKEIRLFLKSLQYIYNTKYTITKESGRTLLHFEINAPRLVHIFMVMALKWVYQYPNSYILKEVLNLKKDEKFKKYNTLFLLNIVSLHKGFGSTLSCSANFISSKWFSPVTMNLKELKHYLYTSSNNSVDNVFMKDLYSDRPIRDLNITPKFIYDDTLVGTSSGIVHRKNQYLKTIKKIHEEYKNIKKY